MSRFSTRPESRLLFQQRNTSFLFVAAFLASVWRPGTSRSFSRCALFVLQAAPRRTDPRHLKPTPFNNGYTRFGWCHTPGSGCAGARKYLFESIYGRRVELQLMSRLQLLADGGEKQAGERRLHTRDSLSRLQRGEAEL